MNYGELKTTIAGYLQRDDLTTVIPDFVDRAYIRIGSDLRNRSNRTEATLSFVDGSALVPTNFAEVISLRDSDDNPLRPADPKNFWQYRQSTGGKALVYLVDQRVQVAPSVSGDFTLTYFRFFDPFTSDSDAVPIPDLYISASLVDAFLYVHNDKMASFHEQRYQQSVARRNREYRQEVQPIRRVANYSTYQGAL